MQWFLRIKVTELGRDLWRSLRPLPKAKSKRRSNRPENRASYSALRHWKQHPPLRRLTAPCPFFMATMNKIHATFLVTSTAEVTSCELSTGHILAQRLCCPSPSLTAIPGHTLFLCKLCIYTYVYMYIYYIYIYNARDHFVAICSSNTSCS